MYSLYQLLLYLGILILYFVIVLSVLLLQTTTTSPTETNNRSNFYNMTLRGSSTIWHGGAFGIQGESSIGGGQCINGFGCVQTPPGFISCQNNIEIPIIVDNAPIRLFLQLGVVNNCSNTEFDPLVDQEVVLALVVILVIPMLEEVLQVMLVILTPLGRFN